MQLNRKNMATMILDATDDHANDAKSALRNALRAKLKSGSSFEESVGSVSSNSSYEDNSNKLIDVETLGNESDDDSGDSDEKDKNDEKETSNTSNHNSIPIEERRLRNRLAARKCREKRKQRILNLEKICNNLESRISMLKSEIDGLDGQRKNLTELLENHTCVRLTPKPTAVITNSVLSK